MKISAHHRILYAKESEEACFMMATVLQFSGIEVITARNIADAWLLAQTEEFDLYLLDSRFPDGNGFDLCHQLYEHSPHVPIVFYSDDSLASDVQTGLNAGAAAYLTKPYFKDVAQTLVEIIERQKHPLLKNTTYSLAELRKGGEIRT